MIFTSPLFLFLFLPIVLGVNYYLNTKWSNVFLFITSLAFYYFGERVYVIVMAISIITNYLIAIFISNIPNQKKIFLFLGVLINLGMLVYFKYSAFILSNIQSILDLFRLGTISPKVKDLRLPIGISFFTFQGLSYLVDVYNNKTKAQTNFIRLGLYISLFPQLIAGPIVRYIDINKSINRRRSNFKLRYDGVNRFIIGLAKKVLIANTFALVADGIFDIPMSQLSTVTVWFGAIAYMFQIYFDFSGYSDMAIGLGKMLGFRFMENFRYPYSAKSLQDFWRRWHISLSTWFRDYVYIPLGGSRISVSRTYINLIIVFFLTGMWHGASWNFIIWGLFHGFFLILERVGLADVLERLPSFLRRLYALLVIVVGWVLFRSNDIEHASLYLMKMFVYERESIASLSHLRYFVNNELLICTVVSLMICSPRINHFFLLKYRRHKWLKHMYTSFLLTVYGLSLLYVSAATYNPFIYFRF